MYLEKIAPGKLLDVGCGDGTRLARFRALGWEVQGQEVDARAAIRARSVAGVPVYLGSLEDGAFADATFDAVVMNHVLEHVHDPVRLLAECHRVLKRSGILVSVTPNIESYGHRRFGSYWRGLEPPRHLFLFSRRTLREAARRAGFGESHVWTTAVNALRLVYDSLYILELHGKRRDSPKTFRRGLLLLAYQVWMTLLCIWDRNSGEECVLRAVK
jgi:SAM-dependent methyltransferase